MKQLTLLVLTGVLLASPAARAQPPSVSALAPAETAFVLEIDDFPAWYAALKDDPIGAYLARHLPPQRLPRTWDRLQRWLGMTERELVQTLVGGRVALVGRELEAGGPVAVFTQIPPNTVQELVDRFQMNFHAQLHDYSVYGSRDGSTRIAAGDPWVIAVAARNGWFLEELLLDVDGKRPRLADAPHFKACMAELPAEPGVVAFARVPETDLVYGMRAQQRGKRIDLHYRGTHPLIAPLLRRHVPAPEVSAAPPRVPAEAVAWLACHVEPRTLANTRAAAFMDRLVAPATLRESILPRLGQTLMIAALPAPPPPEPPAGDAAAEAPAPLPAVVAAVHLRERAVAPELERLTSNLMLLCNGVLVRQGWPAVVIQKTQVGDAEMLMVNLGQSLAQGTGRQELQSLKLVYGRVGDWFVAATQESAVARFAAAQPVEAAPQQEERPRLLTATIKGPALASHLERWVNELQRRRPDLMEPIEFEQQTPGQRLAQKLPGLVEALRSYESLRGELHAGKDSVIYAQAEIQRR